LRSKVREFPGARSPGLKEGTIGIGEQFRHRARDRPEYMVAEETGQFDYLVDPEHVITCGDALCRSRADPKKPTEVGSEALARQSTHLV